MFNRLHSVNHHPIEALVGYMGLSKHETYVKQTRLSPGGSVLLNG